MRNVETYICLQSGLVWVEQWEEERILQVKVLVISTPDLGSGSWYQSSCLVLQVTSGTMNWTSFSTSLHSCQVTGSHCSVPAQISIKVRQSELLRLQH